MVVCGPLASICDWRRDSFDGCLISLGIWLLLAGQDALLAAGGLADVEDFRFT
jgi:hypothetical protein